MRHAPTIKKHRHPFEGDIFLKANEAALLQLESLCAKWLADGRREGGEFVALNPTRVDRHRGSFRINLTTGRWADFATGDRGGDVVGFYAYIHSMPQIVAARALARDLGVTA